MVDNDCVAAGLEVYEPTAENPWDLMLVQHLYLRTGYGISIDEAKASLQKSPEELVDEIVDEAVNLPLPAQPEWHDWSLSDYEDQQEANQQIVDWTSQWVEDMWEHGLRERMALFWSNHFVTELEDYNCPSYMYSYHRLLQEYALGNFKEFTIEMGKTPAMLIYLNGVQNTRFSPNENYARELLELFTLGRDNGYTQMDITETARALTGWNGFTEACAPITYTSNFHDPGEKTIFGQTDTYDYEGLHELLFEERKEEIADFICRKLYREFIGIEDSEEIISDLAQIFLDNEFEIEPVVRTLLKSSFFFDRKQMGTQITSPVDVLISHSKRLNFKPNTNQFYLLFLSAGELSQRIFNPPNVAGWPGDQNWLNTSLITYRWSVMETYIFIILQEKEDEIAEYVREITDAYSDVNQVCRDIIHFLMPWGLPFEEDYNAAVEVFKAEIPENYFENDLWNTDWDTLTSQSALLILHLSKLPEYQLK